MIFASAAAASGPLADVICDTTLRMEQRLKTTLTAEKTASGMRSADSIVEVWTDDRGDWVLVMRYAAGNSCIVAMGEHWEQAGEKPAS
ncbi:hypothetical protein E4Z66_11870 [Aliishimia ponticola]|uniref:Uncharacterized protein n=2 Tax=Aliishimia ponticola TaxID=2499833 RepID=A0A4S4N971_9RHOB|nr:hypothetical protein E4Z66_11870 [Aliishimia ponticola]